METHDNCRHGNCTSQNYTCYRALKWLLLQSIVSLHLSALTTRDMQMNRGSGKIMPTVCLVLVNRGRELIKLVVGNGYICYSHYQNYPK